MLLDKYLWPVPELTPVHEAYELALFQELITDKESLNAMQDCWNHIYWSTTAAKHRISGIHDVIFVLVGILALVKYRLIEPIG
jgi:hypothetical protein